MKPIIKTLLLAGAGWSALAATALAQDAPVTTVDEIVVEARRTAENIQDVPLAISAFSGDALEQLGANDVTDLQGAVPNLNIVQGRGSSDATNIYIRGVGQPDALQTFDPAVGVYIDGVYLSRIRGTQIDFLDLERVEVLRGPQGTLYGKNTIGGALLLVTRRPDSGPYGSISVSGGDYGQGELRVSGAVPLNDVVAVGGGFMMSGRGGYVTDPVTGAEYNDADTMALRGSVAITPNDRLRIDLNADYVEQETGLTVGRAESPLVRTDFGGAAFSTILLPAPAPGSEFNFQTRTTPGLPNQTELTHGGLSAAVTYDLNEAFTLRSITAWRDLEYDDYIDIDASQFELGDVFVGVEQDQISQEFQLNYDNGGPLTFVGGVFYMVENITSHQEAYGDDLFSFLGTPIGFLRTIDDELETTSAAVYLNATYALSDRLRVSGGLRYTNEEKDYFRTTTVDWSSVPVALSAILVDSTFAFDVSDSWSDVSPTLSVDYDISEDMLLYGRISRGFKSGGFNGRANNPGEQQPYEPETVTSYEIGAKADWLDGRVRTNVAVFYNAYEDFQARVSDSVPNPANPTGPALISLTVLNAGELEIFGVEFETVAYLTDNLRIDAQVGYLDASYGEFTDVRFTSFGNSRAFQTPAFSPEWTARLNGDYTLPLGRFGDLTLGATARYRSEMALAIDNTAVNSNVPLESMFQDAYWLYDARVVWTSADGRYEAGLYGRNLSDEVYKTDAQEFSSVGGTRTAYYGAPQTWTFRVTTRF